MKVTLVVKKKKLMRMIFMTQLECLRPTHNYFDDKSQKIEELLDDAKKP